MLSFIEQRLFQLLPIHTIISYGMKLHVLKIPFLVKILINKKSIPKLVCITQIQDVPFFKCEMRILPFDHVGKLLEYVCGSNNNKWTNKIDNGFEYDNWI